MILLLIRSASALDAHGAVVVPSVGEVVPTTVTWDPSTSWRGAWGLSLTTEYARAPLVAHLQEGASTVDQAWIQDLGGTSLSALYTFGRVGLGAGVPLWWLHTTESDAPTDVGVGDIQVWAPIRAVDAEDHLGLLVIPRVELPTGDANAWLGTSSFGAGLDLAVGRRGPKLGGSAQLGLSFRPEETLKNVKRDLVIRAGLAGDWRPVPRFGLGAEAWFDLAATDTDPFSTSSGEALARVGASLGHGFTLTLAGGTGIVDGVGAAEARGWLRIGYGGERPVVAAIEPAPTTLLGPYTLRVDVVDAQGLPMDASVGVTGSLTLPPVSVGADGHLDLQLVPGTFDITVTAPGHLTQRYGLLLGADRFRPAELRPILRPTEGTRAVVLRVTDTEGRPVEGASIAIDGEAQGITTTGGVVEVTGLQDHALSLDVQAPDFRPEAPIAVPTGTSDAPVVLDRAPGSVQVVCRGPDGPVDDAQVLFSGPEELPPAPIGPRGERTFVLVPGDWEVMVSAKAFGIQTRTLHVEPGSTGLIEVDVRLQPAATGDVALVARVTDPDGRPVEGAMVRIDGVSVGSTANGGELRIDGLSVGRRRVEVSGEHYRDAAPTELDLTGGVREVGLVLGWKPGSVEVVARGIEGALTDAQVRLDGPEPFPVTHLGPDGRAHFTLTPGEWHLALSAASYGLQERDLVVRPDDVQLIEIDARLLAQRGPASLRLALTTTDGQPAAGARVAIDDRDAGTVGNTGELRLEGLTSGPHTVTVSGARFRPWSRQTELAAGDNTLGGALAWSPAAVWVRAHGADGPATDAVARFYGEEALPPAALPPDGRRRFELDPGAWALVVSSETLGLAERELTVKAGAEAEQDVDILLSPPPADRGLMLVLVVDPAGHPVRGATLQVDGSSLSTGRTGMLFLRDLRPGHVTLSARAPGFRERPDERVQVDAGLDTRTLRLVPLPRPVSVTVTDERGRPLEATVRVVGAGAPIERTTEKGGVSVDVLPGDWQVLVEAKGYGAWRADVTVTPGVDVVPVAAKLASMRVEVTATAFTLREQVQFDFDQATIRAESYPLLEQISANLLLHPEIARVEVQGHTDARGAEAYNLDLSQRRAEAIVAYLVRRGVDPGRLVAQGYGASRPVAPNDTEDGRTRNRRVELKIGAE